MRNKNDFLHPADALFRAARFWLPAFGLLFALQAGAATLTVTTLDDNTDNDGECSLREAMKNASDDVQVYDDCPAGHRIVLQGSGSHRVLDLGARATPFLLQDAEIRGGRSTNGAGVTVNTPDARFVRVRFVDNIATRRTYRRRWQPTLFQYGYRHGGVRVAADGRRNLLGSFPLKETKTMLRVISTLGVIAALAACSAGDGHDANDSATQVTELADSFMGDMHVALSGRNIKTRAIDRIGLSLDGQGRGPGPDMDEARSRRSGQ